jgi:hypothetical protein
MAGLFSKRLLGAGAALCPFSFGLGLGDGWLGLSQPHPPADNRSTNISNVLKIYLVRIFFITQYSLSAPASYYYHKYYHS